MALAYLVINPKVSMTPCNAPYVCSDMIWDPRTVFMAHVCLVINPKVSMAPWNTPINPKVSMAPWNTPYVCFYCPRMSRD